MPRATPPETKKKRSRPRPMKEEHRQFAKLIVEGKPQTPAYQQVYGPHLSMQVASANACALLRRPSVQAEIKRLRNMADTANALTRIEKREMLAAIARDETQPTADRLKAIQLDNKMAGHDAPVQVQVEVSLLDEIQRRASGVIDVGGAALEQAGDDAEDEPRV